MARLTEPDSGLQLTDPDAIQSYLAECGVPYRRVAEPPPDAVVTDHDALIAHYAATLGPLRDAEGYGHLDVVDVCAQRIPDLDEKMAQFATEHRHAEDEVRLVVRGSGTFHIHPDGAPVVCVDVHAGDLINVPRGVAHWFTLCADRQICTIRLFKDTAGWVPAYTDSGVDARYRSPCLTALRDEG